MKRKALREIHGKSIAELRVIEKKTREELAHLSVDLKAGKLKNIGQLVAGRKNFARVKTIIKERQLKDEKA